MIPVLDYSAVEEAAAKEEKSALLLGNGFAIALDSGFSYGGLFDSAKKAMSERVLRVFAQAGGTDFEAALRLLDDGRWVASQYWEEVDDSNLQGDHEAIRNALVEAVRVCHVASTVDLEDRK